MLFFQVQGSIAARLLTGFSIFAAVAWPQNKSLSIPLVVPAGAPLRLYLTKRVTKRLDAPVEAKVLTPLFAFDHDVVPSGTQAFGHVSRLEPVSRWARLRAVLGGDFTPLHIAEIEFTSLLLPDGHRLDIQTKESSGINSRVPLKAPKHPSQPVPANHGGLIATAKQKAQDQIDTIKGIPDLVRGTDKMDLFYNYAMSRLPYHPQFVWNRTRFDAVLNAPLNFGSETVPATSLELLGSQPPEGSIAHARLLTSVDSQSSQPGEKVQAVLEQPLFSADHKLLLPEGTIVQGTVGMARRARWFHRAGRLGFTFQEIELTPQVAALKSESLKIAEVKTAAAGTHEPGLTLRTQAQVAALKSESLKIAEVKTAAAGTHEPGLTLPTQAQITGAEGGASPVKVDSEGGVQAKESKTRFLGTAVALLITHRAADNDSSRLSNGTNGQSPNISGRTLGGGLGFGLLGSIAAQSSHNVGAAFGYYGMAWSVFSTVFARGPDVEFDGNAAVDIGFNPRTSGK